MPKGRSWERVRATIAAQCAPRAGAAGRRPRAAPRLLEQRVEGGARVVRAWPRRRGCRSDRRFSPARRRCSYLRPAWTGCAPGSAPCTRSAPTCRSSSTGCRSGATRRTCGRRPRIRSCRGRGPSRRSACSGRRRPCSDRCRGRGAPVVVARRPGAGRTAPGGVAVRFLVSAVAVLAVFAQSAALADSRPGGL